MTPTQKRLLAGIVFSVVALIATLFTRADDHEQIVRDLCRAPGLEELQLYGGVGICTHGNDPPAAFAPTDQEPVAASSVCVGNGRRGYRIQAFYGYHRTNETPEALTPLIRKSIRYVIREAQAILDASHPTYTQTLRFHCRDERPTVKVVATEGTAIYTDAEADKVRRADRVSLIFSSHAGICGLGQIELDDRKVGAHLSGPRLSWIGPGCVRGSAVLHELFHNFGAVQHSAPHSSGGSHCYENADNMCYIDGGPYFRAGGAMVNRCPGDRLVDCGFDDYYDPTDPQTGYLSHFWNASDSPFLTNPREK